MTDQTQAARQYAEAMLSNWLEAGGKPSALIGELEKLINEIREAAQEV